MTQPTPVFQGSIVDHKLHTLSRVKAAIRRYLSTFPNGTQIDIVFRKHRSKRSNLQNAYYWSVVVPILAQHFGYDNEEMHEELKLLFNPIQSKIDPGRKIGGSTKKLSTVEFFSDEDSYVNRIARWGATEHGIYIPPPGEIEE